MKTLLKVWKTRPPCDFSTKPQTVFHSLLKIFPHNSSDKPSCQVGKLLILLPIAPKFRTKCPRISKRSFCPAPSGEKFIPAPSCPHNLLTGKIFLTFQRGCQSVFLGATSAFGRWSRQYIFTFYRQKSAFPDGENIFVAFLSMSGYNEAIPWLRVGRTAPRGFFLQRKQKNIGRYLHYAGKRNQYAAEST